MIFFLLSKFISVNDQSIFCWFLEFLGGNVWSFLFTMPTTPIIAFFISITLMCSPPPLLTLSSPDAMGTDTKGIRVKVKLTRTQHGHISSQNSLYATLKVSRGYSLFWPSYQLLTCMAGYCLLFLWKKKWVNHKKKKHGRLVQKSANIDMNCK